ncbi:MAG TPA: WbqC family protein [Flavipsychrobacter sp.]|nr:WbqC family protein [Flavipsychrobacter sp.]
MMQLVSPLTPFPNIYWWLLASEADEVVFDTAENFVKMSYRNRYYITGSNGLIQLTVPLLQGRNQRTPMQDILVDNKERWQVQHWRTIFSVYGRAPYFEHYAPTLQQLFLRKFDRLAVFNEATVRWTMEHAGIELTIEHTAEHRGHVPHNLDIRRTFKPGLEKVALPATDALYYQLFAERNGFYPNLSILDLLFSEGPATKSIIREQKTIIQLWQDLPNVS